MKAILFSLTILLSVVSFGQQSTQHFEVPVKETDTLALKFNHHPTKLLIDYFSGGLGATKATFDITTVYNDTVVAGDTIYLFKNTVTRSTIVLPMTLAESAIVTNGGTVTFIIPVLNQLLSIFGLVCDESRLNK